MLFFVSEEIDRQRKNVSPMRRECIAMIHYAIIKQVAKQFFPVAAKTNTISVTNYIWMY
jgi:hypothetical protein